MDIGSGARWGETSRASICRTLSVVAMIGLSADLLHGQRSNTAEGDRPTRAVEQSTPVIWSMSSTDEISTDALTLHTTRGTLSDMEIPQTWQVTPFPDGLEGVYSTRTLFFFHAFSILLVAGIGILAAGTLWAIPLVSALGPLVLGTAFACLWYCVRRATQEHAN